ncbi:hypothetical protein, partial [Streptomyces sp. NPDC087787]|uniref:hypothetical protein n=1 Tax=Streptomyces sp. NPDC087787 TaxID=3365803 RepID=UPI0037F782FF
MFADHFILGFRQIGLLGDLARRGHDLLAGCGVAPAAPSGWTFPVMLDTRCLRREGVFLLVSLSDLQRGEVS